LAFALADGDGAAIRVKVIELEVNQLHARMALKQSKRGPESDVARL